MVTLPLNVEPPAPLPPVVTINAPISHVVALVEVAGFGHVAPIEIPVVKLPAKFTPVPIAPLVATGTKLPFRFGLDCVLCVSPPVCVCH